MLGRTKSSAGIDKAVAQSVNYEVSLAELARRSERRAWFTAASAMLLALLLAGGYFLLLPLKERTPFLVMADAYTGTARVARLGSDLSGAPTGANQAINRANIAHYVVTRESYDHDLLSAQDWRVVFMMSTPQVASTYRQLYTGKDPDNPLRKYAKQSSIRVNIISITPTADGWFGKVGGASVRFQRVLVNRVNGGTQILDTRLATLLYTYDEELPLSEEQRFDNPLGFQVTEYRVERELVSMPVEPPTATAPAPAAEPAAQQFDAAGMPLQAPPTDPAAPAQPGGQPPAQGFAVPPPPATQPPAQQVPAQPASANTTPNGAINR